MGRGMPVLSQIASWVYDLQVAREFKLQ